MRGELAGVIDEIASGGHANAVRVGFLWMKIHHHPGICYHLVLGDLCNVIVSHDKNGICTLLTSFIVTLRHSPKVFVEGH
jgi:hypothetical protein